MLANSFAGAMIMLVAIKDGGWSELGGMVWAICWFAANAIPVAILSQSYDKERSMRREIEKRWQKELNKQTF